MGRGRKRNGEEDSSNNWMTTYSDLVTLLLTFFVLLFSMASIDKQKFEEIAFSLRSSFLKKSNADKFDVKKGSDIISLTQYDNSRTEDESSDDDRKYNPAGELDESEQEKIMREAKMILTQQAENLRGEISEKISDLGLTDFVSIVREEHNVVFRIDSVFLFDLGKAEIKENGKKGLKKLSSLFSKLEDHEILIQGHTCDLPIETELYPTNWELSTKRASNVARFLQEECGIVPSRLTAAGNSEYKPLMSNDTEKNRIQNRRIDIILAKDYFTLDPQ